MVKSHFKILVKLRSENAVNKLNYILQRLQGPQKNDPHPPDPVVTNQAANQIQKIWRGVRDRDKLRFREDQRRLLIGKHLLVKIHYFFY